MKDTPDFLYTADRSIGLLLPVTREAHEWVERSVHENAEFFGDRLIIEPQYAESVFGRIEIEGLRVKNDPIEE